MSESDAALDTALERPTGPSRFKSVTARLRQARVRDYGIVIGFVALFVTLSLASPAFLTTRNLLNVLDQSAAVGIIACGATLVIIAGGFDLSVGATFAVAGVVAALVAKDVGNSGVGIAAGLGTGVVFGLFNAVLVTAGRINAFVATLASSIMLRGLGLLLTSGMIVTVPLLGFSSIGQTKLLGIKYSVWLLVAFVGFTWFLLSRTAFGRYVYAVGGNPEAARLSGLRVEVIRGATFVISGLSAGLAGVIVASRTSSAQADAGVGLELSAIAAAVIGGTSIMGGEGAIWRTVLGVLLLAMITNGSNLLNVDPTYQQILTGAIIVAAVSVDAWSRRRA
jgi:ribose transport system permease protein